MAKPFSELEKKMSPKARARAQKRAEEMLAEMPIHELRRAREPSQEKMAEILKINKPKFNDIAA